MTRVLIVRVLLPFLVLAAVSDRTSAQKLYFSDYDGIRRCDLDGSNIEVVISPEDISQDLACRPAGIALDLRNEHIYWAGRCRGIWVSRIQRANLDGSEIESLIEHNQAFPHDVEVDWQNGFLYWTQGSCVIDMCVGLPEVWRASLDGSNAERHLDPWPISTPVQIEVDRSNGRVYWADQGGAGWGHSYPTVIHRLDDWDHTPEPIVHSPSASATYFGLAIDADRGLVYWSDIQNNEIRVATTNGAQNTLLIPEIVGGALFLAVDPVNEKLYWSSDYRPWTVMRADTDGSNIETIITDTRGPLGLALDLRGISIGACCDTAPGQGGACAEVDRLDCPETEFTAFTLGATCAEVACWEARGSCCDRRIGSCIDNVLQEDCVGTHAAWVVGLSCASAGCPPAVGACCDSRKPDPSQPLGSCTDDVPLAECQCGTCSWFKATTCQEAECSGDFTAIPTTTLWGQVVLALALLCLAKKRQMSL